MSSAKSVRATPELYSQQRVKHPPPGLTLALLVRRDRTCRLNSVGHAAHPSWGKRRAKEACWWVAARRLVHLNLQDPPPSPLTGRTSRPTRCPVGREVEKIKEEAKDKTIGARKEVG